jgi:hypothetical protein
VLATGGAWYVKNGVALGNPFYPFDFGGLVQSVWQGLHPRMGSGGGAVTGSVRPMLAAQPGHPLSALLHLPLDLLLHQELFIDTDPSIVFPVCLLALPIALWWGPREVRLLALFAAGNLLFWAAGPWELRYAFTAFGALSIVGGAILARVWTIRLPAGRLLCRLAVIGVCALGCLAALADQGVGTATTPLAAKLRVPLAYLAGLTSRNTYITANDDQYAAVAWMNAHLPREAPVAYFWDERSYYSVARHILFLPRDLSFPPAFASPAEERAWLSRFGARYLLVNQQQLRFYAPLSGPPAAVHAYFTQAFEQFRRHHLRLLYRDNSFEVYRVAV